MNRSKAEEIITQLLTNAAGLRYGNVAFSAKVHDGRVVSISYTTTEQTVENQNIRNKTKGIDKNE